MLEYDRIDLSEGIDTNRNILTSYYILLFWFFVIVATESSPK